MSSIGFFAVIYGVRKGVTSFIGINRKKQGQVILQTGSGLIQLWICYLWLKIRMSHEIWFRSQGNLNKNIVGWVNFSGTEYSYDKYSSHPPKYSELGCFYLILKDGKKLYLLHFFFSSFNAISRYFLSLLSANCHTFGGKIVKWFPLFSSQFGI